MTHEQVRGRLVTPGTAVLLLLMAAGAVAAIYRFARGLGAATNLSDQYPWGLWIGVDVFSGVALAAGSFTMAAIVYIFSSEKYHVFIRPALLTGMLGYMFVSLALLVDIAQPLHFWHPAIMWPEHSVMFEVTWCVVFYLTVLVLEFTPVVFERLGWTGAHELWRKLTPAFSIAALAFFVGVISLSWTWAIVTLVFFTVLAVVLSGVAPARGGVPVLLIIAGVVFSTMHQSSLGAVFLLMPDKLHPLWWTPSLPINFFLSAVAVGFAIVIFEATLSAKGFGRSIEKEALAGMGRFLAYALWIYIAFRTIDLAVRGHLVGVFDGGKADLFVVEVVFGVVLPAAMLTSAKVRRSTGGLFVAATLAVLGVVFNRVNVVWLGMTLPGEGTYVPSVLEILITVSIIAAIVFFFALAVRTLPVFPLHEEEMPAPSPAGTGCGGRRDWGEGRGRTLAFAPAGPARLNLVPCAVGFRDRSVIASGAGPPPQGLRPRPARRGGRQRPVRGD
jgi:formate dehydrogenase iron-sulfur subunit